MKSVGSPVIFAVLFWTANCATLPSHTFDANEISNRLEPKLIEAFNKAAIELESEDTEATFSVDSVGFSKNDYAEMHEIKCIHLPTFRATSLKFDANKNELAVNVSLNEVAIKFKGIIINETTNAIDLSSSVINIDEIYGFGNITLTPVGNFLVPSAFETEFNEVGGSFTEEWLDMDGNLTGQLDRVYYDEDVSSAFQLIVKSMYLKFEAKLNMILKKALEQIPLEDIFEDAEEATKYKSEISTRTTKANRIVDDILNIVEKGDFKETKITSDAFTLPQLKETVKMAGIKINTGDISFGKLTRSSDFNLYNLPDSRVLMGYLNLDTITIHRNYTTEYLNDIISGDMNLIDKDRELLLKIIMEKSLSNCNALLEVTPKGSTSIETTVTPSDTSKYLLWKPLELKVPLTGEYNIDLHTTILNHIATYLQKAYEVTPCEATT